MSGRTRQLLVLTLALLVVGGLLVADAVTMSKAKPSFRKETQQFQKLINTTGTTTTLLHPGHRHSEQITTSSTTSSVP